MINHVEMSFQMGFITKLIDLNLRKYGHTYPFIVAVNKDKALDIKIDSDVIMDTRLCKTKDGTLLTEEEEDGSSNIFYVHIIMLRLRSDEDEEAILRVYFEVAERCSPEAMAYVQSCLYNEYNDPNDVSRDEMLQDPDNISVINMSYYLKGDRVPRMSIMPFINKGVDKGSEEDNEFKRLIGEEPESEHSVILASCGWFVPYYKIDPLMPCPYKANS